MKKLFAIIMSMLMIACFMPTMAFAGEGETSKQPISVTDFNTLKTALEAAAGANSGDTTINIEDDITIPEGSNWSSVNINGYQGADIITIHGNGHKITGLNAPLFSGGFAGGSGLVIDKLTLEDVKINDAANTLGIGAFIGCVDSMDIISLTDCHLINSSIVSTGGARVGGLIGWTSGYNNPNDGPVDTFINIKNCSLKNTTLTAKGSVGAIIGHAGSNPATYHTISGCTVSDTKLESTDDGSWRVGVVVGTANVGQVTIEDIKATNTTLKQGTSEVPADDAAKSLYGRFVPGSVSGVLMIDGTQVEGGTAVVAETGGKYYATLQDAVAAVEAGPAKQFGSDATTITLLKDTNAGLDIGDSQGKTPKNIVLDLNNNTLTLGPAVGSKNTETNGIRTLAYSQTEIKNGKIVCSDIKNDKGNYVMCGLANYGKLTLDNVYVQSSEHVQFTINNRGELTLKGKTTVEAGSYGTGNFQDLAIANEVYNAYYENQPLNAKVICDSKDVTVGKMSIEHKATYAGNPNAQVELAISAGTFGEIWDADASKENLTPIIGNITGGTFASDPTPYVANNYKGTQSNGSWTVSKKSSSSGGSGSSAATELDKVKAEANTALSTAAAANKYDDAEQAEVKTILEKAAADIKAAKTEAEVKAIQEAAQAEIDKILTSEEKAEIEAVAGVSSDIFKAKSKLTKLNGKKAIKVTWNVPGSMKLDGYEVFRSTKRYSGFGTEPYFTTSNTSYTNNKGLVKGKTYYYKVRGFVEINGERYYTRFSTKAFRVIK